jgi:gliding motility-associated protein GldM
MALPKEPRQKMINMMYIVLVALLALNVSAEILNAFKIVDKSLITSSLRLSETNNGLYQSLNARLTDEKFADRAKIWQPVASSAGKISGDLFNLIENFKGNLRMEADGRFAADTNFKEDNLDAASRLFNASGKGE